jgi:hypothetical protein
MARRTLAARGAVDVAECERELDHLLAVDQLDHIIRGHILYFSSRVATNCWLDLSAPMLHLNGPPTGFPSTGGVTTPSALGIEVPPTLLARADEAVE